MLSEGDNPPVYAWSEEDEDEDEEEGKGLEVAYKRNNSIGEFLIDLIGASATYSLSSLVSKKLKQNQPPRGKQFWVPRQVQSTDGISTKTLVDYLGFIYYHTLKEAASLCGVEPTSYLEELSGWKAYKIGDEIRFFPPSYKSPEEKALELLNQVESKRKELAKVEKRIANFQNRIKNLSGGKLTGGINFSNASTLRIKELELDLRKQKVLKQKLEKEISKLEENSN